MQRMLELLADDLRYGLREIIVHHINALEGQLNSNDSCHKYRCPITVCTIDR